MGEGQHPATVYIVDDDDSVRRAISRLVRAVGLHPISFATVDALMALDHFAERACVVADVRMPKTSGLSVPGLLARRGEHVPVILLSAQDPDAGRAEAHRAGAAHYLRKPVDDQALIDAIEWVLGAESRDGGGSGDRACLP